MLKKGTTAIGGVFKGTTEIAKIFKGTTLVYNKSILPPGYTELEYIESTGTQYIDTGLKNTECVEINSRVLVPTGTTATIVAGLWTRNAGETNNSYVFAQLVPGSGIRNRTSNWNAYGGNILENTIYSIDSILKSGEQKLYLDGTLVYSDTQTLSTSSNNIYLIARGDGDTPRSLRIYSLQCLDTNKNVLRNFIPAKNSSDVVGLYDLVNNVFYTNAGTGEFIGN